MSKIAILIYSFYCFKFVTEKDLFMELLHGNLIVRFNENKYILPNGKELYKVERWVIQEDDGTNGGTKTQAERDLRKVNPQTAIVLYGNKEIPTGSNIFIHYGAYDMAKDIDYDGQTAFIIHESLVFFSYDSEGKISPKNGFYFGEEVFTEAIKTASGIYITSDEHRREIQQIKITHIPSEKSSQWFDHPFGVGDIVWTIDDSQYRLEFMGKTYVKLMLREISGVLVA